MDKELITNTNFSAFKLFYDELVYKKNAYLSYDKVEKHINDIRELTILIRRMTKYNVKSYMKKLDEVNKLIKDSLNKIYDLNKDFFEYYYILYKAKMVNTNEKIQDMPFIICTSFYDDYRLDNKSILELEKNSNVVPKYSSLEKKDIRNDAKKYQKLEYFLRLLDNNKNNDFFVAKCREVMNIKPKHLETNYEYFQRLEPNLKVLVELMDEFENRIKDTDDYEYICDYMMIAFNKKFYDWVKEFNLILREYFDKLYNDITCNLSLKRNIREINKYSFIDYNNFVLNLEEEKASLDNEFGIGNVYPISYVDESELYRFKNLLISFYYDRRFVINLNDNSDMTDFVKKACDLYSLAIDLVEQCMDKVLYDSSRSKIFNRYNDFDSSLFDKIYELYDPFTLFNRYELVKGKFDKLLNNKGGDFVRKFNALMIDKKREYDYHGPIPTLKIIKTLINGKKQDFIYNNLFYQVDSKSLDKVYDTRNYDMSIIADGISVKDMEILYDRLRYLIETWNKDDFYIGKKKVSVDKQRNILYKSVQCFFIEDIIKKEKISLDTDVKKTYKEVCSKYFRDKYID